MLQPKHKPAEVHNALLELGLNEDVLLTAILKGESARDNCTDNDPRCLPGIVAWGRSSRALREQLLPTGWIRSDLQNRATIVSPDGRTAIAVESGDECTGLKDCVPNTKYQKGDATKRAINANQIGLFDDLYPTAEEIFHPDELRTWLLLRYREGTTLRSELSLPASMSDGRVERWIERIILSPVDLNNSFEVNDDSSDAIDIPVLKKSQR